MGKIKFHPLFVIYVFLCIYFNWFNGVFYYVVSVVLHEYGHYIMARILGYETGGIVFNIYGAGLNTNNIYKKRDDILISLSGPFVNLILIVIIVCFWWLIPNTYLFTYGFFQSNLVIMCFNLLPIYPLDGGRVLYALINNKIKKDKIIKINSIICFVLGIIFIFLFFISIFHGINYNLLFIGLFFACNSIICDKSDYYEKIQAFNKESSKTHEVKVFKVDDFDQKILLKHMSPHYYSIFMMKTKDGFVVKNEEDILKM